jgi:curli biogenesis system outer membrane secretion channel CsgG
MVTAQGFGATAGEAVGEAMKLAILQVNGASIDTSTVSIKYGLDVTLGQDSASLRASSFMDAVRQRSGGVIQNFRVVNLTEPVDKNARFKADIEASIAKFSTPESLKKVKLVIAPLTFDSASLPMGDKSMSATEVGTAVRQRIVDALTNTSRFAVLDRDADPAVQAELDRIASGQTPSAEIAKLSQAVSADLVWSGHISALAYDRHTRKLQTSDRELVSYSGGWALTQKLVNVATRQVALSDSLHGEAPSTEPTTMGVGVDSNKVLSDMTDDLVKQVVSSILQGTFPISVVSRDGMAVVLSQGGQAVRQGASYEVVALGKELKDPQTGQSLGRADAPCCVVVVDRVTPNLSYGHLDGVTSSLDSMPEGALQVRAELKGSTTVATTTKDIGATATEPGSELTAAPIPATMSARSSKRAAISQAPASSVVVEDRKW